MKKLQVVFGLIMVITVFLPWVSVNLGFGIEETAAGIDYEYGILVLVMGICCAGLSFLPNPRMRLMGQVAAGVIALIGVAGYWGTVRSELGLFQEIASPGPGFIICIIVAIGVVITGISQLVRKSVRQSDVTVGEKVNTSCPKCGIINAAADKFCTSCGAELHPTRVQE